MSEIMDIKKLGEYKRAIEGSMSSGIKESIDKLGATMELMRDLSSINHALMELVSEQQHEIDKLKSELDEGNIRLKEKNKHIEEMQIRERTYNGIEQDTLKIVSMMSALDERQEKLEKKEKKLQQQRDAFENEKEALTAETNAAKDKAEKALKEKNEALVQRDEAFSVKKKLEREMETLKKEKSELSNENEKLNEKLKKIKKDKEWYKEYAAETDRKVIAFYRGRKDGLDNHYCEYLINQDKLGEIRERFPEYQVEYEKTVEQKTEGALKEQSAEDDSPVPKE